MATHKIGTFATILCLGAAVTFADAPRHHTKTLSERRAEYKAKGLSRPSGGLVMRKYDGCYIAIANNQNVYSNEEVETALFELRKSLHFPIFGRAECSGKTISVEVELLDNIEGAKANSIVAPEDGWAKVGIGRLVSDSPNPDWRARRLKLALLRAIGNAMGVGYSMYQPCVMGRVRNLSDLDDIKTDKLSPEGENNFEECGKAFGIGKIEYCTYRTACEEGWAPAPTNEVQQAIWDKVHEMPSAPIKIKPETKKVSD